LIGLAAGFSLAFDPFVPIGFFAFFTSSSKKCGKVLDMAEQDVITPLAPGETPRRFRQETGRLHHEAEMPG
jgi:hypothetical protein